MGAITNAVKVVLNDEERKNMVKIFKEALHYMMIEKELPYCYFSSLLYKKGAPDYRNFIGLKKAYNIINNYMYKNGRNMELEDKRNFGKTVLAAGLNTPQILASSIVDGGVFLVQNEQKNIIENISLLKKKLVEMIKKSFNNSIFVKPSDGEGGVHTFKLYRENLNSEDIEILWNAMQKESFVFQENIIQNEQISKIYDKSINTIRIHTYLHEDDKVEIVSALMRFGFGGSIVDNGCSGGFFVSVDTEKWKLCGKGRTYLAAGAKTFVNHPDSDVKLDGYQLPFADEIVRYVTVGAKLFPDNKLIGWDIALTGNGPIVIEANAGPHVVMLQMACGGIKTHPRYKEIFKDYIK